MFEFEWSDRFFGYIFYDRAQGESIKDRLKDILSSIEGGQNVAEIDSEFAWNGVTGFGKPLFILRVTVLQQGLKDLSDSNFESEFAAKVRQAVDLRDRQIREYAEKRREEEAIADRVNSLIIEEEKDSLESISLLKGDELEQKLQELGWIRNEMYYGDVEYLHPKAIAPFGYDVPSLLEYKFDYGYYDED